MSPSTEQQSTTYQRIAIMAHACLPKYEAFNLVTSYNKYKVTMVMNSSEDTVYLRTEGDNLHEVVEKAYYKYLQFVGKLPEFDPNKAIEYVEAED